MNILKNFPRKPIYEKCLKPGSKAYQYKCPHCLSMLTLNCVPKETDACMWCGQKTKFNPKVPT